MGAQETDRYYIYIFVYIIYIIYLYILYNKVDDEKPLNQNVKFHVINCQLNKFTKYDVTHTNVILCKLI